jgi:hypothetical protein
VSPSWVLARFDEEKTSHGPASWNMTACTGVGLVGLRTHCSVLVCARRGRLSVLHVVHRVLQPEGRAGTRLGSSLCPERRRSSPACSNKLRALRAPHVSTLWWARGIAPAHRGIEREMRSSRPERRGIGIMVTRSRRGHHRRVYARAARRCGREVVRGICAVGRHQASAKITVRSISAVW